MTAIFDFSFVRLYKSRLLTWIAGSISLLAYVYLALNSTEYGELGLDQFLLVFGITATFLMGLFCLTTRRRVELDWRDVLVFAILFRVVGLFAFPVLEDDFYRYFWDGWQTQSQGSPYGTSPSTYFSSDEIPPLWSDILDGVAYPEVPTVYGPTAQWFFWFGVLIAPGETWTLQCFAIGADLAVIGMLTRIAHMRWVLLYAWSPLFIKEFAFTAHIDVIGVAFLIGALLLRMQQTSESKHFVYSLSVGVLLALACGIKVFALLAVPFLLQADWRGWVALVFTAVALAWPFGLVDAWLPDGLWVMGNEWLFNAPIYFGIVYTLGWPFIGYAKVVCLGLFASLCVGLFWRSCANGVWPPRKTLALQYPKLAPQAYLTSLTVLFGCLMLTLPALNPWYLVWWLALSVLRPTFTAWTCSLVLVLSYVSGINLGNSQLQPYELPLWVWVVEFGMVAFALLADVWHYRRSKANWVPR